MLHGNFCNSLRLMKLIIRRERLISTIWVLILVAVSIGVAPAIAEMFPDPDGRNQFAASFNNPIMVAMMGPIYGLNNYTPGAMYGGMMLLWYLITVAIMNTFFAVRHTRADEEYGRTEVVRSLPTGRLASINATMISALLLNIILGLLTGLGLAATGVENMSFGGSMLYGAVTAATGFVFASIAVLFSQLLPSTSGATGFSLVSVGLFYLVRAAGDVQGSEILACISPFGLALRSQVYVENNIWPVFLLLTAAIAISAAAYKLNTMRDMGQGFIAAKPGRIAAPKGLLSPVGLAWRLLRTMLIAWATVMFVLGASYSSVIADISTFIGDSPEYMTVIGVPVEMLDILPIAEQEKLIIDSFGTFVIMMMTLICMIPLISTAMKMRSEEREGRAELVITRSVSRSRYMAGYSTLAFLAGAVMQFITAVGLYCTAAAMTGEANPFTFGGLVTSLFVFLPALWFMIGIAIFLIGVLPKAAVAVWAYFGVVCFTSFIGGMVLPEWMLNISPFHFIPQPRPFEEFVIDYTPLIILTVIAASLTVAGFVFYRRRDVVL